MSDQNHICDICHLPIADEDWDDRHQTGIGPGEAEVYHPWCCPACNEEEEEEEE